MRIAWSVPAVTDLTEIPDFLDEQDVRASALVARRVESAERHILNAPRAAQYDRATDSFDKIISGTRLVLTYRIEGDEIRVVRIWHTSRDPATKPGRQ